MRSLALTVILAASVAAASAQTPSKPAPINITGKWTVSLQLEQINATPTVEFKQDGEKLTGTYIGRYGQFPFEGKIKDRALQFVVKMTAEGTDVQMAYSGEVGADSQSMKGTVSLAEMGDGTWTATRAK
jgi:hypothetical protein